MAVLKYGVDYSSMLIVVEGAGPCLRYPAGYPVRPRRRQSSEEAHRPPRGIQGVPHAEINIVV
jgi:hypothetical protein